MGINLIEAVISPSMPGEGMGDGGAHRRPPLEERIAGQPTILFARGGGDGGDDPTQSGLRPAYNEVGIASGVLNFVVGRIHGAMLAGLGRMVQIFHRSGDGGGQSDQSEGVGEGDNSSPT